MSAPFRQEGFLNRDECLAVRLAMDTGAIEDADVLAGGIHRQVLVRNASLIDPAGAVIEAIEARLESCRERVAASLGLALAEREGAGFIRYPAGGFYRPHRDRGDDSEWEGASRRAVALVVFLNTSRDSGHEGEFSGGVLRLFLPQQELEVSPEAGLLVAFPADVLHQVTEVRDGTRDTIVDWFYDPS